MVFSGSQCGSQCVDCGFVLERALIGADQPRMLVGEFPKKNSPPGAHRVTDNQRQFPEAVTVSYSYCMVGDFGANQC